MRVRFCSGLLLVGTWFFDARASANQLRQRCIIASPHGGNLGVPVFCTEGTGSGGHRSVPLHSWGDNSRGVNEPLLDKAAIS